MATPDAPTRARQAFDEWNRAVLDDWYADDPHLQILLQHHGTDADRTAAAEMGRTCPRQIDPLVRLNNRDEHLPRLMRFDGQGNRIEQVDFHPSYHRIGALAYASGVMSRYREPGNELATLALVYLFSQNGEAGHACPMACTAGMIKILQADASNHSEWLNRLLDPDYATHFHAAQFLTEVQGGSDVGANAVHAVADGDCWRLYGEKWFCSVIDADLFLVTARIEGQGDGTRGLGAFVVPRLDPNGEVNQFQVRRLKYKLGTRSMASGETDFTGAWAMRVGDFRTTVEVVLNTSRLYNAICSSGSLQRAAREAYHYARTRLAFGRPILEFPAVARTVALLRTEAAAARGLTFWLAHEADRRALGQSDSARDGAWRMLVNLNKYWTSVSSTLAVRDAIEVLGGNGAIEEFTVLPRLLRDMIVCEAWEGGHNVLCAQAYKDSVKLRLHEPMFECLADLGADPQGLSRVQQRWEQLVEGDSTLALTHIRDVADELRPIAQAAILRAQSRGQAPLLDDCATHLLLVRSPGYDPLQDTQLMARVARILQSTPTAD